MTCKDCIHYDICNMYDGPYISVHLDHTCEYFKDKSLIVELPCKAGQTVYDVVLCDDDIYRIFEMKISAITPFGSLYESKYFQDFIWNIYLTDDYSYAYRVFNDIGKKLFFDKSEAETKLKELNGNERY